MDTNRTHTQIGTHKNDSLHTHYAFTDTLTGYKLYNGPSDDHQRT